MEGGRVLGVNSVCSPKPAETGNLFSDTVSAVSLSPRQVGRSVPLWSRVGCPQCPRTPTGLGVRWPSTAFGHGAFGLVRRRLSAASLDVASPSPKRQRTAAVQNAAVPRGVVLYLGVRQSRRPTRGCPQRYRLCCVALPFPQNIQLQSAGDGRRMLLPDGELLNIARRLGFFRDRRAQPAITS